MGNLPYFRCAHFILLNSVFVDGECAAGKMPGRLRRAVRLSLADQHSYAAPTSRLKDRRRCAARLQESRYKDGVPGGAPSAPGALRVRLPGIGTDPGFDDPAMRLSGYLCDCIIVPGLLQSDPAQQPPL